MITKSNNLKIAAKNHAGNIFEQPLFKSQLAAGLPLPGSSRVDEKYEHNYYGEIRKKKIKVYDQYLVMCYNNSGSSYLPDPDFKGLKELENLVDSFKSENIKIIAAHKFAVLLWCRWGRYKWGDGGEYNNQLELIIKRSSEKMNPFTRALID